MESANVSELAKYLASDAVAAGCPTPMTGENQGQIPAKRGLVCDRMIRRLNGEATLSCGHGIESRQQD